MTARHTRRSRCPGLAAAALLPVLAQGCASSAPATGGNLRRGAPAPADALAKPTPAAALLAARTALADRPTSTAVATEPGVREILTSTRSIIPTGERLVHKVISRPGPAAADGSDTWIPDDRTLQTLHLRTDPDGSLVLLCTTESADNVTTDFEPPMLVLPATMAVGQTATQTLKMVVRPISDPSRIKTSGDATQTITYEGDERLTVPAGEFATRRVRSVLTATLGQARVVATTITWYADDIGQVAEFREEAVTVLGVRIRHNARTWAALPPSP